jgi:1-acyl-sn-glycerol-3-phosphate acyltransferase
MKARSPLFNRLLHWIGLRWLALMGWRSTVSLPDLPRYVIVLAPHTSYLDGLLGILADAVATCGFYTARISWLGKHTLFYPPHGLLIRALGGVPVDRRARHALVDQVVEAFRSRERMVLAVTPEGARHKTRYWRTGFYYIALGADVPMLLCYVDYKSKTVGSGPLIHPSGNIHADVAKMRAFYSQFTARYPEKVGEMDVPPQ